ncbi:hypothetical protein [Leifsonia sp. SIMBA_070]|uniref:hypothetical protein n=1 Tax=Leifsonia sp. SIMBA_070 TaxID=3085810 RepID=UPI0039786403
MSSTRDPLLALFEAPEDLELVVGIGWQPFIIGDDPERVQIKDGGLPQRFACYVRSKDDERPFLAWLLFFADPEDDEVRLLSVIAPKMDADKALERITENKPLEWWRSYATLALTQSKQRLDPEDLEAFYGTTYGSKVAAARARHPANQVREPSNPPRRTRARMTPELFEEVARVYESAEEADESPIAAVAFHFEKTYPTASRWVSEARKRGLLPTPPSPADRRK